MKTEDVAKLPPLERFLYWIRERFDVYQRRLAGQPKPWTDDVVMQRTYFTNVCREWDKTTVWARGNIREPMNDDPTVIFAVLAFRWFNRIPTGELLLGRGMGNWHASWLHTNLLVGWDTQTAVNRLNAYRNEGGQVFTGAFNISNGGSRKGKIERVCEDYIRPVWDNMPSLVADARGWTTLAQAHSRLIQYPGMGGSGFMAAQVVADLKYTPWLAEGRVSDWWTWCALGPGARRGLNIILGFPPEGPAPGGWRNKINWLRSVVRRSLPEVPPLHAQDLQNCLCEFGKMERIRAGGHSKRGYGKTT
jgi:hypothetical protein